MSNPHRVLRSRPPDILISQDDFHDLTRLAEGVGGPLAAAADQLLTELDRARCVPARLLPHDRVRMMDHVVFETEDAGPRRVQLVTPDSADIASGRISVLTPVGAALIGLSVGQSIAFMTPTGAQHCLTVCSVARAG